MIEGFEQDSPCMGIVEYFGDDLRPPIDEVHPPVFNLQISGFFLLDCLVHES